MGFPTSMFTALFAIARTVGWVAQWQEMLEDTDAKLMRPRQLFMGPDERHYVPIEQRGLISRLSPMFAVLAMAPEIAARPNCLSRVSRHGRAWPGRSTCRALVRFGVGGQDKHGHHE